MARALPRNPRADRPKLRSDGPPRRPLADAGGGRPRRWRRWVGQDGHDFGGGPSPEERGNDVQDIHIVLSGMPPGRTIAHAMFSGHGADEWEYNGKYTPWTAVLKQAPGSTSADLFLEPTRVETGRSFTLQLRYDDGTTAELTFQGRTADPNLRMPGAALQVRWGGQDRQDWTGPGPAVGPDGLQDVRLELANLSPKVEVRDHPRRPRRRGLAVRPEPQGARERRAHPAPGDPSRADLYFQPDRRPRRQDPADDRRLRQRQGRSRLGGRGTHQPGAGHAGRPLPKFVTHAISARWLGQDGRPASNPGDVHVALAGLPAGRTVVAASLSDSAWGYWAYRAEGRPKSEARPPRSARLPACEDRTRADLFFAPDRDESGAKMVLRLTFEDGAMAVVDFPGGPATPA